MDGSEVALQTQWQCTVAAAEIESIALRLASDAARAEELCGQLSAVLNLGWESPAGHRFREHMVSQRQELLGAVGLVAVAASMAAKHAEETTRLRSQ